MIHVSAACNANLHTTTSHYLGADTTAFTQLLTSNLFAVFPDAAPHHPPWRWSGARSTGVASGASPRTWSCPRWPRRCSATSGSTPACTTRPGIDLLLRVVPIDNILFASEMLGAVRGVDPETGHHFDDTRRYLDAAELTDAQRQQIYETNARRVFPRLTCDDLAASDSSVESGRNVVTATRSPGGSSGGSPDVSAVSTTRASLAHCSSAVSCVALDGAGEPALRD